MKVAIYSLGCKVNIYESEYVTDLLKKNNYEIVDFESKADIYIINTCTVTNESDKKSRKIINRARKSNKEAIIIVMGCYSQIKYKDIIDKADIIIGNKDKSKIVELIEEYLKNKKQIIKIYDLKDQDFEKMEISKFLNHTRAFVKIQDGCNNYCTYCIIPYVRGNIRSKKENDIIEEVTTLVNNGYKEIVLTGIHTGKYGKDIGSSLEQLLNKLVNIPNIYRLRLSSIEINEITDGIIELIKNNRIIARHLHIPLQSGSDKVLKLMNRRYDKEYFIKRIKEIRSIISDISITTDLIVGFPNEGIEEFNETIDTLNTIKFTKIHTFPYSKREGTIASNMNNQVADNTKKERVKQILKLSLLHEEAYYQKYVGKEVECLTELKDNLTIAHTSNYLPIILNKVINNNKIITVKIDSIDNNKLIGKI